MQADRPLPTRKDFLLAMSGAALLPRQLTGQLPAQNQHKVLMVVAHPDDEYAFAATTYRMVRELALNYQIVVNWVIAEHKSQGLFQKDSGVHDLEQFWLFRISGDGAAKRADELSASLCAVKPNSAQ